MKKFKWTVEIEVDETWVADGFDLTDERVHAMVSNDLSYAFDHEIKCKVIKRPSMVEVNIAQGAEPDFPREGWPSLNSRKNAEDAIARVRNERSKTP